ncbi:type II secretion system inner membrane protein GspF [Enterobacter ludwigii]|uniref:type II secretion system inner membrane protein GspF n=1 Tax=Enterobacter ludwigii TaxID=299767 RepID=UPI001E5FF9A1|nr:type II secretion system inner membrane protein GspF [Enterobacter ludwigii]MCE1613402.1 type II secretion system inner membrane protein GspF [Enterobacter ludwigii]MCE1626703.1 type II secretion system inner membrane protein GspF [Enterobacter ludwigii]
MVKFKYRACDRAGKITRGIVEADSLRTARQQLREKQLTVLSIVPVGDGVFSGLLNFQQRVRMSNGELVLFTRKLATLSAAAIPLEEALYVVGCQTEKKKVANLVMQIRLRVLEGFSLAQSLRQYPGVFDRLFCAMIEAGEATGQLASLLHRLAEYVEQQKKLKNKIIHAITYPIVLTLVAISVVSLLLTVVVPKVVEQFIHLKHALPVTTQLLIAGSDFLKHWGGVIILMTVSFGLLFNQWIKKSERRLAWHRTVLKIPVIGALQLSLNTTHYASTLSILHTSSVPLLDSMRISASVLSNEYARAQLTIAMEKVREGESLNKALEGTEIFSPMMNHMIASGESSGELGGMLKRAADMQQDDLNQKITMALSLFEPVLVIGMAGMVLFIILAIMQPILQLNSLI